jgi:L-fucose/D-arabinose isomerase
MNNQPEVAIITFTDDREDGISSPEVESFLEQKQMELKEFLELNGIDVADPLGELRKDSKGWYGVRNLEDVDGIIRILSNYSFEGVIIGAWTWSSPMTVMEFVRKISKPILYYTENDPMSGNLSQMSATCASLMEWGINTHALKHERCFDDRDCVLKWIKAVSAYNKIRESAMLLWGGTYAVRMEQLQDDIPRLKSFLIRDVLFEDQYILINRAEKILKNQQERIDKFKNWLLENGLKIKYDNSMLTHEAFDKQIALLISARDRLKDMEADNINGVSIKCQPEIYKEYGVNACTLPAFLPLAFNENGKQKIYPTVCEGDIKGLLTSMILFFLNNEVPPAFGDLVSVEDDYIEFANCGAGSLFWSANSNDIRKTLKNTEAVSNIHGVSGAAFSYYGKELDEITVARLTRIRGKHYMQLGKGRALDARKILNLKYGKKISGHLGQTWGKIVIDLGVKAQNFVKVIGANHLTMTKGDFTEEIEILCRQVDIPVVRIDSDRDMKEFYKNIRYLSNDRPY